MATQIQHASISYNKNTYIVDPLTTADATQTIAFSIPFSTNKAAYVVVNFVANNSTYANVSGGNVQAVFARATGNVSRTNVSNTTGILATILSSFVATQPSVDIVANTTTQAVDVKVTGLLATTISWHLEIIAYISN